MAPKRKEAAADGSKGAEAAADADDKPQKKAKQEKEKRTNEHGATVRYKSKPTIKDMERMQRALSTGMGASHRLYLIERKAMQAVGSEDGAVAQFVVLGATKNVYTVTVGRYLHCTCPDFAKGNVCKHQLFVMLRVLKLAQDNPVVWQRALLKSEVRRYQKHTNACLSSTQQRHDACILYSSRVCT